MSERDRTQRNTYAHCVTLQEVISASCLSRLRKQRLPFNNRVRRESISIERIRRLFQEGRELTWTRDFSQQPGRSR